jgi:hypothetical protein
MSDRRITVTRDDGETVYELVIKYAGRYQAATHLDPEEWPDPYLDAAWLNQKPLALNLVPDDVLDEAIAIDADGDPEEPDPPEDR